MPSVDPEGPPLLPRTRQRTRSSPETHKLFLILSSHLCQVSRAVSCHKMLELRFCTLYLSLCVLSPVSTSVIASPRYHHSFCECNSSNNKCFVTWNIFVHFLINHWKVKDSFQLARSGLVSNCSAVPIRLHCSTLLSVWKIHYKFCCPRLTRTVVTFTAWVGLLLSPCWPSE